MPQTAKEPIPPDLRGQILVRDDFTCCYCGRRWPLSVDHKIPESQGGTLDPDNLVTACIRCNSQKGTTSYEAFLAFSRGFFPIDRYDPQTGLPFRPYISLGIAGFYDRVLLVNAYRSEGQDDLARLIYRDSVKRFGRKFQKMFQF